MIASCNAVVFEFCFNFLVRKAFSEKPFLDFLKKSCLRALVVARGQITVDQKREKTGDGACRSSDVSTKGLEGANCQHLSLVRNQKAGRENVRERSRERFVGCQNNICAV